MPEVGLVAYGLEQRARAEARHRPPVFSIPIHDMTTPPKVFISYSHDSDDHKDRVWALADRLRRDGIDCNIDQYEPSPAEGWPRWTLNQVDWADFVLVVCTEQYDRRFRGAEELGRGRGVTWEGGVIIQELYDAQGMNSKYVPVFFELKDEKFIPRSLGGASRYKLDEKYVLLCRLLTGQPENVKPPLGAPISLPPRDRRSDFAENSSAGVANVRDRTSVSSLRQLIDRALSDEELNNLCFDEFPDVYNQTIGQNRPYRLRELAQYVVRQGKIAELLNSVKRKNPHAYTEFMSD